MITKEQLLHVIENTKIALSEEETQALHGELESALNIFASLDEAEIEDTEPLFYPNEQQYFFRDEAITFRNDRDELLSNTVDAENGYFKFPAVLKGGTQ